MYVSNTIFLISLIQIIYFFPIIQILGKLKTYINQILA